MPSYIFLSFLAAFSFALSGIFNKVASKHAINKRWPLLNYQQVRFDGQKNNH